MYKIEFDLRYYLVHMVEYQKEGKYLDNIDRFFIKDITDLLSIF